MIVCQALKMLVWAKVATHAVSTTTHAAIKSCLISGCFMIFCIQIKMCLLDCIDEYEKKQIFDDFFAGRGGGDLSMMNC
jgi:hypothetical protein